MDDESFHMPHMCMLCIRDKVIVEMAHTTWMLCEKSSSSRMTSASAATMNN